MILTNQLLYTDLETVYSIVWGASYIHHTLPKEKATFHCHIYFAENIKKKKNHDLNAYAIL